MVATKRNRQTPNARVGFRHASARPSAASPSMPAAAHNAVLSGMPNHPAPGGTTVSAIWWSEHSETGSTARQANSQNTRASV